MKDNKGMTLVELMIAISISVIVIGAAGIFLKTALNSYNKAATSIDLQTEAQIIVEQMNAWIMEGNYVESNGVGWTDIMDGAGGVGGNLIGHKKTDGDILVIFHAPNISPTLKPSSYESSIDKTTLVRIIWKGSSSNKLYMLEETSRPGTHNSFFADETNLYKLSNYTASILSAYELEDNCIGEYISDFKLDLNQEVKVQNAVEAVSTESVKISLVFQEGNDDYSIANTVKLRNEIYKKP